MILADVLQEFPLWVRLVIVGVACITIPLGILDARDRR